MNIKSITVTAGRTFNHPHEQFSNLRPEVTMTADLSEGEDPLAATRQLQAQAEALVEDHKQSLLKSLEELYLMSERQAEMRGLQRQLEDAQIRLNEIRKELPGLALTNGEQAV
jgi:hypothetical protein